jgi:hypothetical protein
MTNVIYVEKMAFKYRTYMSQWLIFLFSSVFLAKGSEELEAKDLNKNWTVSALGSRRPLSTCSHTSDISAGQKYSCCANSYVSSVEYDVVVPTDSDDNFYARICSDSSCSTTYASTQCDVKSSNTACTGSACYYYSAYTQYDCYLSRSYFSSSTYQPCFVFQCKNYWYDCDISAIDVSFYGSSTTNPSSSPPPPSPPPPSPPPSGGSSSVYSPSYTYTGTGSSDVRIATTTARTGRRATGKIAGIVVGVVVTFLIAVVKYCCFTKKNEAAEENEQNTTPPVTVLVQQQNTEGRDEPAAMPTMPMEAKQKPSPTVTDSTATSKFCTKCGSAIVSNGMFCASCGKAASS